MQKCRYCGIEIYFDRNIKSESGKPIPMEEKTLKKHDCVGSPKHPLNKEYGEKVLGGDTDNDNSAITRMLDSHARREITTKTLKPSHESELALQQHIDELERDLYSKDAEFQDFKRKTDAKITKLEDRIQELENKINKK
jgi:hypothetical protein